jgi:hypothetical protein
MGYAPYVDQLIPIGGRPADGVLGDSFRCLQQHTQRRHESRPLRFR